jgi:hypothetical protein
LGMLSFLINHLGDSTQNGNMQSWRNAGIAESPSMTLQFTFLSRWRAARSKMKPKNRPAERLTCQDVTIIPRICLGDNSARKIGTIIDSNAVLMPRYSLIANRCCQCFAQEDARLAEKLTNPATNKLVRRPYTAMGQPQNIAKNAPEISGAALTSPTVQSFVVYCSEPHQFESTVQGQNMFATLMADMSHPCASAPIEQAVRSNKWALDKFFHFIQRLFCSYCLIARCSFSSSVRLRPGSSKLGGVNLPVLYR